MAPSVDKFIPILFSELLIEPTTFCRGASTAMAWAGCTLGESTTLATGRTFDKAAVRATMLKMRKEAGGVAASFNQGDINDFLDGLGSPLKLGDVIFNKPFDEIISQLDTGGRLFYVTLAGNTNSVPRNSPLRRYVNPVAHELVLIDHLRDKKLIRFIDPMTPHGVAAYARWAPVADFKLFSNEFELGGGARVAERWPVGAYTVASVARRAAASSIEWKNSRIKELETAVDRHASAIAIQDKRMADKDRRIKELEGTQGNVDVRKLHDHLAAAELSLVDTADAIEAAFELLPTP